MKKILILLVCGTLFNCAVSSDSFGQESAWQNQLTEILLPKGKHFDIENLKSGSIIHAYKVTTYEPDCRPRHMGYYIGAQVATFLDLHPSNHGRQTITFYKWTDSGIERKHIDSANWCVKTIKGKKYTVHQYDGFKVYSSNDEQYVKVN